MKIQLIKKVNEILPAWIKKPFSPIIRNKLINNKIFLDQYNELLDLDMCIEDELKLIQFERLKDTLVYAYNNTKYYRKIFDSVNFNPCQMKNLEDLENIPILDKKKLSDNYNDIISEDVDDAYSVSTGGTSGAPIHLLMDRKAIFKEWAFIYHYWSKYGYNFRESRLATFRGVDLNNKISEENPLYREIRLNPFIMNDNNIEKYIHKIKNYKADFLYGYPSAIYNFCRLVEKHRIDISKMFTAVFLISENLYDFQEEIIKKVTGCKIAMFYGHTERAVFAERTDKGYVFNRLYGFTELSNEGCPIVTSFINRKMPLIRYMVDDKVSLVDNNTYSIIGHRDMEVLHGNNGEQVSVASINFHDDTFDAVTAYQFVQEEIGKCTLRIQSDNSLSEVDINKIHKRVSQKLGKGFVCDVRKVDKIELTKRGKYKMLIQDIKLDL
ncbi:MAG: phenylacetate--CoA ligase family protein [Lachnospiraceae bacterium]|nr:phenylacetate--CoA ligase family protein [Lachnospiraceae bacterium]